MPLLSRKGILAIAAVVDVAIHGKDRPVPAKALAARHRLPPRHLEPLLQALVREGILKGIRGPQGGYALARERRRISADDVLRAASLSDESSQPSLPGSALIHQAILPMLRGAEQALSAALGRISIADITERAQNL
jgi:Rrf2 family iron-sulfur cluster assembly transcriptional regulator